MSLVLDKDYLSKKEAAAYCCVSVDHFHKNCPVASFRLMGKVVYSRADLQTWVESVKREQHGNPQTIQG